MLFADVCTVFENETANFPLQQKTAWRPWPLTLWHLTVCSGYTRNGKPFSEIGTRARFSFRVTSIKGTDADTDIQRLIHNGSS